MKLFEWKKTIHLVRGLPGEGKSTLALKLVGGDRTRVVENDDYWMVGEFAYSFTASFLKASYPKEYQEAIESSRYSYQREMTHLAAQWCGAEAFRRLRMFDTIAVANVFAKREHIIGYLEEGRRLGVRIILHRPSTKWTGDTDQCFTKNIHAVPLIMIQQMKEQWEEMSQERG